jgi:type I restriction-modification system DNA methylase subunit
MSNKETKKNTNNNKNINKAKIDDNNNTIKIDNKNNNMVKMDNKNKFINIFQNCLNILRDNEGLTGDKALRNMSYLLILKLIEPHFGNKIDIDNYEYDFSHIDDNFVKEHKIKLLEIVRFSNLVKEKEDNIPTNIKYLWDDILSKHPATKNIFLSEKGFDIQRQTTYIKIINKLNSIDLSQTEYDVLGNAYEEVIQDIMTGKVLGQYFTQPLIKKMMVELINPQIYPDGKIDTCCDPTMGTGGFLITYLKYILEQSKTKNIEPDWNFIKNNGLYGKELEPDTYQLAVSNMLISSGHMFEKLDRGDSIREPITTKFDNIIANPPFGIKGLKYNELNNSLKINYIPIKSDSAVSLFIQAIICMLKINGKCAIVIPNGQDLFSKTKKSLIMIREYLMKTCDLKEIIHLPSGIFTYTSIKTCVFYFVKKIEGVDILEIENKKDNIVYKFCKTHQTTNVIFYEYNPYENIKKLIIDVSIDKIVDNLYSLNYNEYLKTDVLNVGYKNDIIIKTLDEICDIKYGTRIVKKNNNDESKYPVYGSGRAMFHTNTYNREGYNILIGRFALSQECVRIINENIFLNDSGLTINPKTNNILHKYIGYYFLYNQYIIYNCARGTAQKNLEMELFKKIKIPIPSIEKQQEIVKYLDIIEETTKISINNIDKIKILNNFCLNNQKIYGNNSIKTIGEVCDVKQGNTLTKTEMINGIYDVIGGGKNIGKHTETNRNGEELTLTRVGDININYMDKSYYLTDNGFSLKSNKKYIITKYIYYFLLNNKENIIDLYKGTAQKVISKTNLKEIKISIPSIECQKEIIDYCENNDILIKQLENEIENNKKQACKFIDTICKLQDQIIVNNV